MAPETWNPLGADCSALSDRFLFCVGGQLSKVELWTRVEPPEDQGRELDPFLNTLFIVAVREQCPNEGRFKPAFC